MRAQFGPHSRTTNQWWMTAVGGLPFIVIMILVVTAIISILTFVFGVAFLYKNITFLAIVIGGMVALINVAKTGKITGRELAGFLLAAMAFWLIAGNLGLFAQGIQNQDFEVKVNTMDNMPALSVADGETPSSVDKSSFSFTCNTPLENVAGCRMGPGTYRPVSIDICNKDPELPMPPHNVLVSVDPDFSLSRGDSLTLNDINVPRDASAREDLYITSGDPTDDNSWLNKLSKYFTGQKSGDPEVAKDEMILVPEALPPGSCYSDVYGTPIGVTEDGEPKLFVVAGQAAKMDTRHMLQIALIEARGEDSWLDGIQSFLDSHGWLAPVAGAAAGFVGAGPLGAAALGLGSLGAVNGAQALTQAMSTSLERTVFAVGGYEILIAQPWVEIFVVLGSIGIVGLAVAWLFRLGPLG